MINGSQPFVRGFTGFYAKSTGKWGEHGEKSEDFLDFLFFFVFFRLGILENYPRRASASFWTDLELRKPTFHRFRYNCGLVASTTATATTTIAAAQRRQLGDCGLVATTTATATTTIAAAQRRWRLRRWRW